MKGSHVITYDEYSDEMLDFSLELREQGIYRRQVRNPLAWATIRVSRMGQVYETEPFVLEDIDSGARDCTFYALKDNPKRSKNLDEKLKAGAVRMALALGINLSR